MIRRKVLALMLVLGLAFPAAFASADPGSVNRLDVQSLPEKVERLKLDTPESVAEMGLHPSLMNASGPQRVLVRLANPSVGQQKLKGKAAKDAKRAAKADQGDLLSRIQRLDPNVTVLGQVQLVLNAVVVEVDGSVLRELANDPAVARISPVGNYKLDLSETVPHVGAAAVQASGFDGTGIRVAVLDSGIDYTHAALGGSGDVADFDSNDPNVIEEGTFPTAKVVGGYDYVGSNWPLTPEEFDPDPIDDGPERGHGTHVGHIIAGEGGVAPGAELYAVKVCSSVSPACSGLALMMAMEFAADPDGDGDPSDAVDVINMSLGSDYGQPFDDDLAMAVNGATELGILTVASAGNGSNKPYVTGTPAAAISALSVAQTTVPSEFLPLMEVLSPSAMAGQYPAVFQPWSVYPEEAIEAEMVYGDGNGGNLLGCDPFAADLSGKIVLVDRGACNFTLKIKNIGEAGGLVGIIGLVNADAPFSGGDGGDRPIDIPGYMIAKVYNDQLKAAYNSGETVTLRFDPTVGLPMVNMMVGSSARGPRNYDNKVKPEIGAPGASISAIAGSGTETGPFGGTSGAAPMVTGTAALLLQAHPDLTPLEAKARLMNTGETDIKTDPISQQLAPITRIGGGEVRVDRAVAAQAAAWDDKEPSAALSFGFVDVAKDSVTLSRKVRVRNYASEDKTFQINSSFRYDVDEALDAVSIKTPKSVKVKAGKDATFTVTLTIKGENLLDNYMNSGGMGNSEAALTLNEFDGYITLDDGDQPIHLPWHVLPRKAADLSVTPPVLNPGESTLTLKNNGVGTAQTDVYALLAANEDLPEGGEGQGNPTPDIRAVGVQTYPVPAGFCSDEESFVWAFAINTWERQTHLVPVSHMVELDTNMDGTPDFLVLNRDVTLNDVTDGRQLTWTVDLNTGMADAWFFAEHSTNTGNTVLWLCGEQVGLTGTDMLNTNVGMNVYATDFYFGGSGDEVTGLVVTPLGERYYGVTADIPGNSNGSLEVYDFGAFPGNTPELGLLLLTNGDRGSGARGGATQKTEAIILRSTKKK